MLYINLFSAIIVVVGGSCHLVWLSPVVPKLQSNDTDINPLSRPVTTIETSLLAGFPYLVGLLGSIFVGKLSDIIGRKRTMLYVAVLILISNIIIALSSDVYVYIFARCIIFVMFSACLVLVPMYLLEICEDHNRAKFGSLMGLAMPIGNLYTYVFGSLVSSVQLLTFLCGLPIIPFLIIFSLFAPESPVYLASKGKLTLAMQALEKLRKNKSPQEIEKECEKIHKSIKVKLTEERVGLGTLFRHRVSRKTLFLALIPIVVQHLSGVTVIMQFLAPIFNEADTYLSGNTISIIAGIIKMTIILTTAMKVERFGRRPLLIMSTFGSGIALFFMGLFFYWKHFNWIYIDKVMWLPILCLICNLIMYSIGMGPISLAVVTELFPGHTRAIGMSFVVTLSQITIFLLNFLFPIIVAEFGIYCCVWFFSFCCFIGSYFIYRFIPETRGKSIVEIQEIIENI